VVGKPIQEDFFIGEAMQEMTLPLLEDHPTGGGTDLWAYPETGFHALAVMSVNERYPKEALNTPWACWGRGRCR
jgi:3-polyprenyl-4-hydroxybenzoate decarboxylase